MGSHLSMMVASLVMEDVKDRALTMSNIDIRFWQRYMDDTCVTLLASKCKAFVGHLNRVELAIHLTLEQ